MKIVVINQMTAWARVFQWKRFRFVWYRVGRSGEDWRILEIGKKYEKPQKFDFDKVAKKLQKKYPSSAPLPAILDEKAADAEVARNTPSAKKSER